MEPGPARSIEEWVVGAAPSYARGSLGSSGSEAVGGPSVMTDFADPFDDGAVLIPHSLRVSGPISGVGGWLSRSPVRTSRESREASRDDNGSR